MRVIDEYVRAIFPGFKEGGPNGVTEAFLEGGHGVYCVGKIGLPDLLAALEDYLDPGVLDFLRAVAKADAEFTLFFRVAGFTVSLAQFMEFYLSIQEGNEYVAGYGVDLMQVVPLPFDPEVVVKLEHAASEKFRTEFTAMVIEG